jgi:hypothetical protein
MYNALLSLVIALAIVYAAYWYLGGRAGSSTNDIISSTHNGRKEFKSAQSLPPSLNDPKGLTYGFTCWLRVDDYSYRYGQPKVVFVRGSTDMSVAGPAVYFDANTNDLLVKVDTFGSPEIISISNLPAKKWFHFGLVVDQDSVDIYINGILKTHKSLTQLPRTNPSMVTVSPDGGFDGKIANLKYYNYYLTPSQIAALVGVAPEADKEETEAPVPQYSDITWWIGRH